MATLVLTAAPGSAACPASADFPGGRAAGARGRASPSPHRHLQSSHRVADVFVEMVKPCGEKAAGFPVSLRARVAAVPLEFTELKEGKTKKVCA